MTQKHKETQNHDKDKQEVEAKNQSLRLEFTDQETRIAHNETEHLRIVSDLENKQTDLVGQIEEKNQQIEVSTRPADQVAS
jgi:hypothetical protein